MDHEDDRIATSPPIAYNNNFETKEQICSQVKEVLEDVLPGKKLVLVDDNKIKSVVSRVRSYCSNVCPLACDGQNMHSAASQ